MLGIAGHEYFSWDMKILRRKLNDFLKEFKYMRENGVRS